MVEKLFFASRKAEKFLRKEGAEFGLSPLFLRTVFVIFKNPNCTADIISEKLVSDKALTTRTVATLMEKGFIEREKNPNDKRSFLLKPTDKLLKIKDRLQEIEKECGEYIKEVADTELVKILG